MKATFLILCDVIFLVRLQGKFEILILNSWGEGLNILPQHATNSSLLPPPTHSPPPPPPAKDLTGGDGYWYMDTYPGGESVLMMCSTLPGG